MHPMRPVTSYACVLCLAVVSEIPVLAQATPVLDLTKIPPSQRMSLGVPGQQLGSITGQKPPKLEIPVSIQIKSAEANKASVKVQMVVINRGGQVFTLPSCTDQRIAQMGRTKRRTFEFGFEFLKGNSRKPEVAEVTFTSDKSGCSIPLLPGRSALVIMNVNIPPEFRASTEPIQLQAVCKEWTLDNRRYYITRISDPVKSLPVEIHVH